MMNPIICAIDTHKLDEAEHLIHQIKDYVGAVKLGLEFFMYNGRDGVKVIEKLGVPIFLDLKLHDIPNTVAGAIKSLSSLNIFMLTIHTSGGYEMMHRACMTALEESEKHNKRKPLIVGVTVLTSLDQKDLQQIGCNKTVEDQVINLAKLANETGLDGIVCSPHEIKLVRNNTSNKLKIVVPGIRAEGDNSNDQKRIMTPVYALNQGANFLVIGRSITNSDNPKEKAYEIYDLIRKR